MGARAPGLIALARASAALLGLGLSPGLGAAGAEGHALESAPAGVDTCALARRAEAVLRGDTHTLEATLTIESPGLTRTRRLRLRAWDDRRRGRSFLRVLAPARHAGTALLKRVPNLWAYTPRAGHTVYVPPSMWREAWLASDFSHGDLVHAWSEVRDCPQRVLRREAYPEAPGGGGAWIIEFVPREGAPSIPGRIVAWIDAEHGAPLRREYFDENGEKLRVLRFSDFRSVQGRPYPHRWEMSSARQKGHRSTLEVHSIVFDEPHEESVFSTRSLRPAD